MTFNQSQAYQNFDAIALSVASPEQILSWSHGEVKKPETINYRTQKPERDGLFCEKIFGPTKNYECYCGKYKRIRYKGVICEKCGVEVTHSSVRRQRMGHIKLAVPVTHIWYLRSTPSRLGLLLNLPVKTIEQVVYFAAYIVTSVNHELKDSTKEQLTQEFKAYKKKLVEEYENEKRALAEATGTSKKQEEEVEKEFARKLELLTTQHNQAKSDIDNLHVGHVLSEIEYRDMSLKFGHIFTAGTGAESIDQIIREMDLEKTFQELEVETNASSGQRKKKLIKRIKLIGSLIQSEIRPDWMILKALPVIPPELRPMVQLDGGRFAASDLNDLYRRVINRNNRLKKLLSIGAPEVICRNEKRMLQEAVDTLLNMSARQSRASFTAGNRRKLKSLSDMLKGKQGRFRQNLLGKRVDYSGRSVIVVGPTLQLNECGLPKEMALTLFKPFVISKLISLGYAHNIKNAEKLIQSGEKEVWDLLEEVIKDKFVLLNRAPTLHRLGIQAFKPKLIEGKAIQLHPLVCVAFNADFDGDQMAVHVPLSEAAQKEAKELIQSSRNLLKPAAGDPTITPSQDMVLGCYFLTKSTSNQKGENMVFASETEALAAYQLNKVDLQSPIKVEMHNEIFETTVGRIIFNQVLPEKLQFINQTIDKKNLSNIIAQAIDEYDQETVSKMVDRIKELGFKYATLSGITIATSDMIIPEEKHAIVEQANEEVKKISNLHWKGVINEEERKQNTIKVWAKAKNDIQDKLIKNFTEESDIHYMVNSGARGKWGQVTQISGMKGLVANPSGETIELPVKSSLKEGFSILEYFIATHGGRKGKSDTALKTAEAGYLTRKLVDSVQDVIIREYECGTTEFHSITKEESKRLGVDFETRIYGRLAGKDIVDPTTGEVIVAANEAIKRITAMELQKNPNIQAVEVRSPLTCKTIGGVCQKCYGKDLGNNLPVDIGAPVGIIAAQSIGEPGTQLTMRTFHMGGVAQESDITQGLTRVAEVFEARNPKSPAILANINGTVQIESKGNKTEIILTSNGPVETKYEIPEGFMPQVTVGEEVAAKQTLAKAGQTSKAIKSKETGIVKFVDNFEVILETKDTVTEKYVIPKGKNLKISSGDSVEKGQALTSGSINLKDLTKLTSPYHTLSYIISEIQGIYASQGQTIHEKHLEIIARQMLSKARVLEQGDSKFLVGEIKDKLEIDFENQRLEAEGKKPSKYEHLLLGLTRISLNTDSWLSSASFQETIRVLVEAATTKQIDHLQGLKENVIIGKLIPVGETFKKMKELNKDIN